MTSQSDIEIDRVAKVYGAGATAFRALDDVSLRVTENAFFTLLGPSGCGKTTLLRLIAGFEPPTSGAIRLGGRDVGGLGPNRRPVNTVFQNYALFPHMTVAENIGFGLRMQGKPRAETRETVARMLALVRMEALADRRPAQISGGQQQRVALARALAPSPRVLLLDEPLSALDLKLRKEMQGELKRLQTETGITFLFVTHDQEEALTMSDRIAVMSDGRVLQVGSPREIYDRPAERFVADFIGDTNFLDATLVTGGGSPCAWIDGADPLPAHLPEGMAPREGAAVTVVIRPEHARLDPAGGLRGEVTSLVYFGTDTLVHLRLANGAPFALRRQNGAGGPALPEVGAQVRVALAPSGVQVLRG